MTVPTDRLPLERVLDYSSESEMAPCCAKDVQECHSMLADRYSVSPAINFRSEGGCPQTYWNAG